MLTPKHKRQAEKTAKPAKKSLHKRKQVSGGERYFRIDSVKYPMIYRIDTGGELTGILSKHDFAAE